MLLKIAVRNVHKNLRSMAMNGIGIALTVLLFVFVFSLSRGVEKQIVQRNIRFETGGVVVHLKKGLAGWENKTQGDSLYRIIRDKLDNDQRVRTYRTRVTANNASLYGKDVVKRIQVEGITPDEMPLLYEMLLLPEEYINWNGKQNGLLISYDLSVETGLSLQDDCAIVLPSADGSVNMQDYVVTGIFRNTSQADKYQTYMSYGQAKELYHTNLPTRLLVDLEDLGEAGCVASSLGAAVRSADVEIKTYKDFMGRAQALSGINRNALLGIVSFLLFISFVGVWAMITEQVNERRKEIGMLLTFGFTRGNVRCIFLMESVYVSLMFLSAGLVFALAIIGLISYHQGLYLGRLASFAFGSATILPESEVHDLLFAAATALFYPILATWTSLYSMGKTKVITLLK